MPADMTGEIHPSSMKVQEALQALGCPSIVRQLGESTATSAQAAEAVGATVGQIAKSLLFMADGQPVMVIASGANRVDVHKLAALTDGAVKVRKADADTVREVTGFVIGGVPPVGLKSPMQIFIDRDLLQYDEIWAAAGTPRSVFAIAPAELVRITGAAVVDIAEARPEAHG